MGSPSKITYTASALSTDGGRNGHVRSSSGALDVDLRPPVEDGQQTATNPEELFAAGYAACFHSALRGRAKAAGVELADTSVVAEVGLGPFAEGEGTGYGLRVALVVSASGVSRDELRRLVDAAHEVCPYSNATRGNVDVTLQVEVA